MHMRIITFNPSLPLSPEGAWACLYFPKTLERLLTRTGAASGMDSSMADQDDFGPRILAAVWSVGLLSSIALALRLYCKVKRSRQAWYDDYVLVAAWVRSVFSRCPPPQLLLLAHVCVAFSYEI